MIVRDVSKLSKASQEVGSVSAIVQSGGVIDICGYVDPSDIQQHGFNAIILTDDADVFIKGVELPPDGNWLASIKAEELRGGSKSANVRVFAASEAGGTMYPLRLKADDSETYSTSIRNMPSPGVDVVAEPAVQRDTKSGDKSKLRVFYLGAQTHLQLDGKASLSDLLKATGNNTGNMLIGHAIKRQIDALEISSDFSLGHKRIEENFDLIVIGAANFIAPFFDFEVYAKFLEAVRLPCVIIGLGAQARDYGIRVEMPKGTERMLRIVSERSASLGVRGNFTAGNLYDMGIKNVRVVGCPSMYWSCRPRLNLRWTPGRTPLAVAVNGSGVSVTQSFDVKAAEKVEAMIARLSYSLGYTYVLQNEKALMEIAGGEEVISEPISNLMKRYGLSELSPETFMSFVKKRMKSYFDIDQWVAETGELDFVLGTRFHGCLIALHAGIPCFVFVHDSRTREMCELLGIPHLDVRKAGVIDPNALYNSLDLSGMETAYRHLYQHYVSFLEENHVPHRLPTS